MSLDATRRWRVTRTWLDEGMQSPPPRERFEREYGCTETEWLRTLPGAVGAHQLRSAAPGQALVAIGNGELELNWTELPPRQIALIRMPRLLMSFRFDGVQAPDRQSFMRYFDLYMLKGGG